MARTKSSVSAKIPARNAYQKYVTQHASARFDFGDSRVGADIGFVDPSLSDYVASLSGGTLTADFAQSSQDNDARKFVSSMGAVVESANRGVLVADVTKWGPIAIWFLAFVAHKVTTLASDLADKATDEFLNRVYDNLQKKAGTGTRMAVVRGANEAYALVPGYNGPGDKVDVVYSSLVDLGRAAAKDPGLHPCAAQLHAIGVIAERCWKDAVARVRRDHHDVSLDSLIETDSAVVYTYNEDRGTPWASVCTVTRKDGTTTEVMPDMEEIVYTPESMGELRLGNADFIQIHAKYVGRPADVQALAHRSRSEIMKLVAKRVSDDEHGLAIKGLVGILLDLRAADSLRKVDESDVDDATRKAKRYRNLKPSEIVCDLTDPTRPAEGVHVRWSETSSKSGIMPGGLFTQAGYSVTITSQMVKDALELIAKAEDDYHAAVVASETA